jgi:hypothetical protein
LKMGIEMLAVRWNDMRGLYKAPIMAPQEAVGKPASATVTK